MHICFLNFFVFPIKKKGLRICFENQFRIRNASQILKILDIVFDLVKNFGYTLQKKKKKTIFIGKCRET